MDFELNDEQKMFQRIVRDFCDHANALCADCKFPELARNYALAQQKA